MKYLTPVISIFVMLMVALSAVIQFHHHDDNGDIVFAVSLICFNDIEHGHCVHHNCCSEDEHSRDCEDESNCSAHIGDFQATKEISVSFQKLPVLLSWFIVGESDSCLKCVMECLQFFEKKDKILYIEDWVLNSLILRAPPTV